MSSSKLKMIGTVICPLCRPLGQSTADRWDTYSRPVDSPHKGTKMENQLHVMTPSQTMLGRIRCVYRMWPYVTFKGLRKYGKYRTIVTTITRGLGYNVNPCWCLCQLTKDFLHGFSLADGCDTSQSNARSQIYFIFYLFLLPTKSWYSLLFWSYPLGNYRSA